MALPGAGAAQDRECQAKALTPPTVVRVQPTPSLQGSFCTPPPHRRPQEASVDSSLGVHGSLMGHPFEAICVSKTAPTLPIPAPKGVKGGSSGLVQAVGGASADRRVKGLAPGMRSCPQGWRSPPLPLPPPCSLQVAGLTPALSPANPSHTESSQPASGSCFTGMLASNLRSEMNSLSDYFYL